MTSVAAAREELGREKQDWGRDRAALEKRMEGLVRDGEEREKEHIAGLFKVVDSISRYA